jgi:hypothetical protein
MFRSLANVNVGCTAIDWVHTTTTEHVSLNQKTPVCLFVHSITATTKDHYALVPFLQLGKKEGSV